MWEVPGMGNPEAAWISCEESGLQDSLKLVVCALSYAYIALPAALMETPSMFNRGNSADSHGIWLQKYLQNDTKWLQIVHLNESFML